MNNTERIIKSFELQKGIPIEKVCIPAYEYLEYFGRENASNKVETPFVSESLYSYLKDIKSRISIYGSQWDVIKKYTNDFEFVHTCIPGSNKAVCSYRPISRSFFKMIEILQAFRLNEILQNQVDEVVVGILCDGSPVRCPARDQRDSQSEQREVPASRSYTQRSLKELSPLSVFGNLCPSMSGNTSRCSQKGIKSFHLAEGPGGFIEALAKVRNNKNDVYYGMTLLSTRGSNIPNWRKDRLYFIPAFELETAEDGTGDLLSLPNLLYCREKYKNSIDIVTADAGFDFSLDYQSQERDMLHLLFAEVCYAILIQRHRGTFILKIFDCFTAATVDILFLLSSLYETVSMCKPCTSRAANSEKYVICTGFIPHNTDDSYVSRIISTFETMLLSRATHKSSPLIDLRFLSIKIPYAFYKNIEEANSVFGQSQLENILQTINLIELRNKWDRAQTLQRTNVQHCIDFCIKHNLSYSKR